VRQLIDSATVPEVLRLDIKKAIAKGGVAMVWLTHDRAVGRSVAMKLMCDEAIAEPMLVHGFFREAQVLGQLNHPNVVPIHEVGLRQGRPYFTMGLVSGQSLSTWLRNVTPGDCERLADFLEIITKVCDALEYAHSRSVVHGDLKPANIMVGSFGEVYVMDWGGAKLLDPRNDQAVTDRLPPLPKEETEGKIFGTATYMSPQQANAEPPSQSWDVFSLGAIIYQFITGNAPFQAADSAGALAKAQQCDFKPLTLEEHGKALPPELLRVVTRAMASHAEDRYPGIALMRSDLSRIMRGGGTFPVVEFPKDTTVIAEGNTDRTAYIVHSGTLEVFRVNGMDKISLRLLNAGDVFGEMAMFASTPRTASVRTLTDVRLFRITEDVLRRELDHMTPWMATFVRTLAERFAEQKALGG
jgi:serine/threonine-protein kinase